MTNWLLETLVATTLLMVLVLAIRGWVSARFGARTAYLLWAAPAIRMILPPLPASCGATEIAPVRDVVVVLTGPSSHPVETAAATGGGVAWPIVVMAIWLGGAAFLFGRHWFAYLRFARDIARTGDTEGGEAMARVDTIPVTRSAAVVSPIAMGVFGKQVIVPADFAYRYDADEQRLALAHELVHHRRFDVAANFAGLAILALHWWNPIAHLAHRAFRIDQEAACDAVVLDGADASDRHSYGSALFKSAMGRVPLAACAMGATTTLKHRLRRIVENGNDTRLAAGGMMMAASVIVMGVALTASATAVRPQKPRIAFAPVEVVRTAMAAPAAPVPPSMPVVTDARASRHMVVRAVAVVSPGPLVATDAPVAPFPPAPPVADIPPPPAAPAAPAVPVLASCEGGVQVATQLAFHGDGERRAIRITVCRPVGVDRGVMLQALQSARASIVREDSMCEEDKAKALAAIDGKIARLSRLPVITMQ